MVSMDATNTFPAKHMAGGTFAEGHCRGPGQQPQAPNANMHNQYGRIGHWPFLEIYTWTGAPVFHRKTLAPTPRARVSRSGSTPDWPRLRLRRVASARNLSSTIS